MKTYTSWDRVIEDGFEWACLDCPRIYKLSLWADRHAFVKGHTMLPVEYLLPNGDPRIQIKVEELTKATR